MIVRNVHRPSPHQRSPGKGVSREPHRAASPASGWQPGFTTKRELPRRRRSAGPIFAAGDVMANFYSNTIVSKGDSATMRTHYRGDDRFDLVGSMMFTSKKFMGQIGQTAV